MINGLGKLFGPSLLSPIFMIFSEREEWNGDPVIKATSLFERCHIAYEYNLKKILNIFTKWLAWFAFEKLNK